MTIDMKVTAVPTNDSTQTNPTICGTYSLSRKANTCKITPVRVTDPIDAKFMPQDNGYVVKSVTLSSVESHIADVGLTFNGNWCGKLYGSFNGSTLSLKFTHFSYVCQLSIGSTLTLTAEFT